MIRHKRTIEQKFKAIVAMIVAMGLVSGFTLQDGTINSAHSTMSAKLICTVEEHTHSDSCYSAPGDKTSALICGKTEHVHEESCYCSSHTTDTLSNANGTHTITCSNCGANETVECTFGKWQHKSLDDTHMRICSECGYKETDSAIPTITYTYTSNYKHVKACSKCDLNETQPCTPGEVTILHSSDTDSFVIACIKCDHKMMLPELDALKKVMDKAVEYGYSNDFSDDENNGALTDAGKSWIGGLDSDKQKEIYDLIKDYEDIIEAKPENYYTDMPADYAKKLEDYADENFEFKTFPEIEKEFKDVVDPDPKELPPTTPPTLGATPDSDNQIKLTIYDSDNTKDITPSTDVLWIYEIGDIGNTSKWIKWNKKKILQIDTSISENIKVDGNYILLKNGETFGIDQNLPVAEYQNCSINDLKFTVSAGTPGTVSVSSTSITDEITAENSDTEIRVHLFKEVSPVIKQFKVGTTTELKDGSLELSNGTDKIQWNYGDTLIVGNPTTGKAISKVGKIITVRRGKTIDLDNLSTPVPPYGYKELQNGPYSFEFDEEGNVQSLTVNDLGSTDEVEEGASSTKEVDVYYDEETNQPITVTLAGAGVSSSTEAKVYDKATGKEIPISGGKFTCYANREYKVTAIKPKTGYKVTPGTFKLDASANVDTVSGNVSKVADDEVKLTIDDSFGSDDYVEIAVYEKEDDEDKPDTSKVIRGWTYKFYYYDEDSGKYKAFDGDYKTLSLKSTASEKYVKIPLRKLTVGMKYKLVQEGSINGYEDGDDVKFTIDEDGKPVILDGPAEEDDDQVQIYLEPEDEDSDNVIAVHKVDNAGTELAGAHLQIYAYTDSNTLVYGSSSSASTSTNSTTSSAASVTASIGDEDENTTSSTSSTRTSSSNTSTNRTSSASTTRAKTTPTKPTVATSSVIVDWTSGTKGYVIDIDKLEKGKNYTLREVSAPSGYETPPYDFVFKYGTDGNLSIVRNYNGLLSVTGNKLVLKNQTPTEAAATRPKTGDHSKLALWLDICIVMLGGLYLSGFSVLEAFTEKKKVKVVAKKKPNNRRRR